MKHPARRGGRPDRHQQQHRGGGSDWLYGRNGVIEALRGPRVVHKLYLADGIQPDRRIEGVIGLAAEHNIAIERVDRVQLDHWSQGGHHQGVMARAAQYPYATLDDLVERGGNLLLLDHLQDPQNLGTLLRTAEAAAIGGVLIPADRAAAITPAVVNASAGAVEHLAIARVTNLARAITTLKERDWWIVALDTGPDAVDLFTTDLPSPIALVVGSEGPGLGQNIRRLCDLVVSLPMRGQVASLNAATAGAIALFDLVRRESTAQTRTHKS